MAPDAQNVADYIVVGAGSAGCALAARLSENPAIRILLVEAGGSDSLAAIKLPVGYARTMGDPRVDWCFQMGPEPQLNGRFMAYTRGKVLGGSSSLNGLAYVRGGRENYDAWAASGCPNWDWESVLPYFKRSEDFEGGEVEGEERGRGGPLKVRMNNFHPLSQRLVNAACDAGLPATLDHNAVEPMGFARSQLNLWRGQRFSAADAYYRPARARPNLQLLDQATTLKLRVENGATTGVDILRGGERIALSAAREVIVCAGAISSPLLLEKSGIGSARRLAALGVDVTADSPDVGENLQDHFMVFARRRLHGVTSFNEESRGIRLAANAINYALFKKGFLSGTPTEVVGFGRVGSDAGPADVQFFGAPMTYAVRLDKANNPYVTVENLPGISLGVYQCHPRSRGHVHLADADGAAAPSIVANYLSDPEDQRLTLAGLKLAQKILRQPPIDEVGAEELAPGPAARSDDELLDYARQTGTTAYHAAGTCRMGSDNKAVVDTELRVRGMRRLRVADASVMPLLVGANTHAATVMIGERCADFLRGA